MEVTTPDPKCPGCQALQAEVRTLRELVAAQQAQLEPLQEQVRELSARLNRHSGNSSQPPSADPPSAPPRAALPRTGRRPGGPKGHPGHRRRLPEPDQVVPCTPPQCRGCGAAFAPSTTGDAFRRHVVVELPPIQPEITEYQLHARTCAACGTRTWGDLPIGVPTHGFGPRLQALATTLTGAYRLSRRDTVQWLADCLGVPMSVGALSRLEARTTLALAAAYQEAATATAQAAAVNVDETSWKERGKRPWLWLAATPLVAYFRIADGRTRAAFEELLPPERGPDRPPRRVMSDRFSSYGHPEPWQRGLCWAHLRRDFQGCLDLGGKGAWVARWALAEITKLFTHWHAFRARTETRATLQEKMAPVQQAFQTLLQAGSECACRKTAALCTNLLAGWAGLWTFVREPGVEPTNNHAERCLRRAVLWRKNSFGTQSEGGRRFVERLLTVTVSLRLQGRSVVEFVRRACQATLLGSTPPSLLPASTL